MNCPDPERPLSGHAPGPASGRNAGRVEGAAPPSAGVILDALSLTPRVAPQLGAASAGKGSWCRDLQRMWALEGSQVSRVGGQAQAGPFLSGDSTQAGGLAPQDCSVQALRHPGQSH